MGQGYPLGVDETVKFISGLLFAAVPFALAAQQAPGKGYTMTTVIDSGGRKMTMIMQLETMGPRLRTYMKSDMIAPSPVEVVTIFDSTASTFTTVMPKQSMVMIASTSMVHDAGGRPPYTSEFTEGPKSEVVDLGAGEKILGYPTRHYRQSLSYTLKFTIGDETCSMPHAEVDDVWTTTAVKLPDLTGAIKGMAGATAAAGAAGKLDSLSKAVPGVALRRIGVSRSKTAAGDSLRVTTTMDITAIHTDSVDARDFEIPAGYNVMDMSKSPIDMNSDAMKQVMESSRSKAQEQLKKSMCGVSDTRKP